jgi:hypothetical protein
MSALASVAHSAGRSDDHHSLIGELAEVWQGLRHRLSDPYRPERHYMRGPGPKCREKALVNSQPSAERARNPDAAVSWLAPRLMNTRFQTSA